MKHYVAPHLGQARLNRLARMPGDPVARARAELMLWGLLGVTNALASEHLRACVGPHPALRAWPTPSPATHAAPISLTQAQPLISNDVGGPKRPESITHDADRMDHDARVHRAPRAHAPSPRSETTPDVRPTTGARSSGPSRPLDSMSPRVGSSPDGTQTHGEAIARRAWYQPMLDWLTNWPDPLALPGAEAAPPGVPAPHVHHFLDTLRTALIESDTLTTLQAERLITSVAPLTAHGILIVPLESSEVPLDARCAFIEEIFEASGQRVGAALLSQIELGTHAASEVPHTLLLLGLSRPVARAVARNFKHRLQGAFGALCGSATMQRWSAFGRTLNVEHARHDGLDNPLILPNALAPRPSDDAAMDAPTFILRDPDNGIHRDITLHIVSPDSTRWLPLLYLRENWFTTHETHASAMLVYLSLLSHKGRYAQGWNEDAFHPGEFAVRLSEASPYVALENHSHTIACEPSGCAVFTDDAGGQTGSTYLDPLSITWHASPHDTPSRLTHEKTLELRTWRVAPTRDDRYIEFKQPIPDSGPLFAVHHAGALTEAAPLYYVAEVAGALFPARFNQHPNGTFHSELYDLQDPTGTGVPITWDGGSWQLERTVGPSRTASNTPPHGASTRQPVDAPHASPCPADHRPDESTPNPAAPFQVVDNFHHKVRTAFPDLHDLARTTLHQALLNDHHVDLDPDRTWFMRFDLAQSDPQTITGWAHVGPPVEARPLTQCLLTNFPASAQENPWVLDQLSGLYHTNASATGLFDGRSEVRLRPSQLMQTVWQIDFYRLAKSTLEHAWQRPDIQDMNNGVALSIDLANTRLEAVDRDSILASVGYLNTSAPATPAVVTINRYSATDLLVFDTGDRAILYMPRHTNPNERFAVFANTAALHQGIAAMCADPDQRRQIAQHFSQCDRQAHVADDGVDRWLETLSGPDGASYLARIGSERLHGQSVFHVLAERQQQRALSDLDTLIQSNAEVRKVIWARYFDAINVVLPNPLTPFVSIGLHLDQALNGDTYEARLAGVRSILSDSANLALMAVLDSLTVAERTGFALDGAAFHANVRERLAALSQAGAIEWDGQRWAVEHDTSSHVSTTLKTVIVPDMYAREVPEAALAFPDSMGLRQAANGHTYLKVHGRFVEIRPLAGALNRYYIDSHPKLVVRFEDGQFRPETTAERLAVVADVGLGGRQGKLKFPLAPAFVPADLTDISMTPYLTPTPSKRRLLRVLEGDPKLRSAEKQLHIEVRERAEQMDVAAKDFFDRLAAIPPTLAPALEAGLSDAQTFDALLRQHPGIVIGEYHSQPESKLLLVENMPVLKRQGVQTLYLEGLVADLHETDLAAYFASPDAPLPATLQAWSDQIARGNWIDPAGAGTFRALLEAARANDIQVKPLDCAATIIDDELTRSIDFLTADDIDGTRRLRKMNYFGSAIIRQHQSATGNDKWVALVGASHINTHEGVPTIDDLTDAIGVWIKVKRRYRRTDIQPGLMLRGKNRGFGYVWKRPPAKLRRHRHGAVHMRSRRRRTLAHRFGRG